MPSRFSKALKAIVNSRNEKAKEYLKGSQFGT